MRVIYLSELFSRFPVEGTQGLKFERERLFSTSSDGLMAKELVYLNPKVSTGSSSNHPVRMRGCSPVYRNAR